MDLHDPLFTSLTLLSDRSRWGCGLSPRSHTSVLKLGLFGTPIAHSLSPKLHEAAALSCGMKMKYRCFESSTITFHQQLIEAQNWKIHGASVTAPIKKKAWDLCQHRTLSAELIGAVNTLAWTEDGLVGHNTDVIGLLHSLIETVNLRQIERAILIGNGGAANASLLALLLLSERYRWDKLQIAARSSQQSGQLCERLTDWNASFSLATSHLIQPQLLSLKTLGQLKLSTPTLLISALPPLSTHFWQDQLPKASAGSMIFDLNYGVDRCASLESVASSFGYHYISGLGMLVEQGIEAFKWWSNRSPESRVVYSKMNGVEEQRF